MLDDIYVDAQLEEIDTLYSELYLLNQNNNYNNFSKYNQLDIEKEKVKDLIIFYSMFKAFVVIAVYSTLITHQVYKTFNIIFLQIIYNHNNPMLHVN